MPAGARTLRLAGTPASRSDGSPSKRCRLSLWERAVDGAVLDLSVFLGATFAAALVAGVAGFAFGLVAAAVWLHILDPAQTAALIIAFGLVVQGFAVWKLRHALKWDQLWPFLLGRARGAAVGLAS